MLISVKQLTKCVVIMYALGSVNEKFGVWIKAVPKSLQRRNFQPGLAKRTAKPFQTETSVPNWFRRRTFHALISMYEVRLVKRSATEPCLNLSYKEEGYLKGNRTLFLKKSLVEWLSRENNAKHKSARKFTSLQQVPPISTKLHQSALNCTTLYQVTPNSSNLR